MAFKCDMCDKGVMVGKQHKHHAGVAGQRWLKKAPKTRKLFRPNLHNSRILIGVGLLRKTMKLCTKCLRRARAAEKIYLAPKESIINMSITGKTSVATP